MKVTTFKTYKEYKFIICSAKKFNVCSSCPDKQRCNSCVTTMLYRFDDDESLPFDYSIDAEDIGIYLGDFDNDYDDLYSDDCHNCPSDACDECPSKLAFIARGIRMRTAPVITSDMPF